MKKLPYIVIGAVAAILIYGILSNYNSKKSEKLDAPKTYNNSTKEEKSKISENRPIDTNFEGLIKFILFDNCDILITSTNNKEYKIGTLENSGTKKPSSIQTPRFKISPTGNYVVFEDVSGGVDLWLKVFSAQTKEINTIGVLGTSSLLDLEFINNDRIALLTGYKDNPKEQWLNLYDLPTIYKEYPKNINEFGSFTNIDINTKNLPIKEVAGDNFEVIYDSVNLYVYGGTKKDSVKRGEFAIKDL